VQDAIKTLNMDILYPTKLPDYVELNEIVLSKHGDKNKIVLTFDNKEFTYTVILDDKLPEEVYSDNNVEIVEIREIKCYLIDMPDLEKVQVYFEYKDDLYVLRYNNKQDLIEVIENLNEFQ
jgi:hypothetical protein